MEISEFFNAVGVAIWKVVYHLSPALVTVVLGGVIVQRFFVSKANEATYIDEIIAQIDSIVTDVLEYWNLDPSDSEEQNRAHILEQKIKGGIRGLNSDVRYFSARYCTIKADRCHTEDDVNHLVTLLADACTGGAFESAGRTPDRERYLTCVNAAIKLKSNLMRQKI
jgi:hypothetical protein